MPWSETQLRETIDSLRQHGGDSPYVELKKASGGMPQNLGPTLCAFANMPDGGSIICGIDESNDFAATGVKTPAKLQAGIASVARNDVHPSPYLDFNTLTLDGVKILVTEVRPLPAADKPVRYKGRAYLRQADGDYAMNEVELRMLEVAKLHLDEHSMYDEAPASGTVAKDLDEDLVRQYIDNIRAASRRLRNKTDEEVLHQTRVLTASGEATLAGLYALGNYPQGYRPALTATAAVVLPSDAPGRHKNLEDFRGPLPEILGDMMRWTEQNLPTRAVYNEHGHLHDIPALPLPLVRELIANALVHRDLGPYVGTSHSVQLRIMPDRLVIENPGGVLGLSIGQLESAEHAQLAVNQHLYQIAKYVRSADGHRVIEGEGGGIREVLELARKYGLPKPQFINTGVKFKVIVFFAPEPSTSAPTGGTAGIRKESRAKPAQPQRHKRRIKQEQGRFYNLGKNVPAVAAALSAGSRSLPELAELTGLSQRQVRYALGALTRAGYARRDSRAGLRNTVYHLEPSAREEPREPETPSTAERKGK